MSNDVIEAIKSRNTRMRPRWYFIIRTVGVIIAIVLMFLLILFFVSFMIFALRADGGLLAASYGFAGWYVFFHALPWTLLLLSLALIFVLVILLKRYSFIYHRPFLYSLLALAIVIGLGGFLIAATSLHSGIFEYASHNDMQFVQGIYQFEMTPPSGGIYRGEVVALVPSGFILESPSGQTSTILIASDTPIATSAFSIGDYVVIFGRSVSTATIEVFGVQRESVY